MEDLKPGPANTSPLTPLSFIERAATVYDDCPSIIYDNTTYTWSQTYHRCIKLASSLSSLGISRGHVVSVLAPNVPAMYELHFAVPMAGAVLNTINIRLDARTISVLLQHGESELLFVDNLCVSLVLDAIALFPPDAKPPALVLVADDEVNSSPAIDQFIDTYEGLVIKGDPSFKWVRPISEWDPIVLNYTSGTTSSPKGVVHCHRGSFISAINGLIDWFVPNQPVFLWTLPMFHSNGWNYPWSLAVVGGVNICLRKFDGPTIYRLIKKHNVTHMCAAPVVLNMLSNNYSPTDDNSQTPTLKNPVHILTAGAPPPASVLSRTESLGFIVSHGYGMTETGGTVVSCAWKSKWNQFPATERARLKARQGVRTIGMIEVDVLDPETGKSVKRDGLSLGEIVLRGGCIMLGYLKNPETTSKQMNDDGWFFTGDVGVMHPDGYLEIKDRSKDVSSVEVESVLYTHPDIKEAAVVARPDEFWGETPCAFVSLKDSGNGLIDQAMIEKKIIEYCRARMPHFMVPKMVVVIKGELPKTSTGKIKKFVLRDMARAMGSSRVSCL
ncbi:2-methylpropanoate--CoA ligase CCL4 [Ricinus communis]|uniref:2-methylpropanoate--CoA ligase CCL4 n=1 Tax=Ricinus communis TaxID=3988 RepID=UPI00201A2E8B|nr:2-methylpropanoate--CoA ligase CCL4 [Ricinus communis]